MTGEFTAYFPSVSYNEPLCFQVYLGLYSKELPSSGNWATETINSPIESAEGIQPCWLQITGKSTDAALYIHNTPIQWGLGCLGL